MAQLNLHNTSIKPPPRLLPLLQKIKNLYLLWFIYYQKLPKTHRHTLGQKVDTLLTEIIEAVAAATYLGYEEKRLYIKLAIRKVDTLKIFLMILWKTKSLDNKKYISLSEKLNEIGKMLGGWSGQVLKQNSSKKY